MSKYEVKLVNIGEEVDNRIRELEKENTLLKKECEQHIWVNGELKTEVKDIRKANDNLTRANESYRQENIDLKKSGKHYKKLVEDNFISSVNDLDKQDEKMKRLAYLEKVFASNRYVFSEIPNTEENMKMVKLMKKHINPDRYNLRWRGQYLIDGEDWRKYTDGQPMNKSKCIRVYIDSKGSDTTEGFKESEVHAIREGLDLLVDSCEENIRSWSSTDLDTDADEDLINEKKTLETTQQLLSYFTSMVIHLEESKLARAEVTNNVT